MSSKAESKTATKEDTRVTLLKAGRRVIVEKGYNHAGIQEILLVADVPKGSFYHFFNSKEEFGLAIINYDAQIHDQIVDQYLKDKSRSPLNRLKRYFAFKIKEFESLQYREGCLFGNLSQEMSDQNEAFRIQLQKATERWREQFAECIKEAQLKGEITSKKKPRELADFCLNSWEGSLLQMKVTKSNAPLKIFVQFVFGVVLR